MKKWIERNENLLAGIAVASILAVSIMIGPWTRSQTGGRQIERAETASATVVDRVSSSCAAPIEQTGRSIRISVPRGVNDRATSARIVSANGTVTMKMDGGSCWSWDSLTAFAGNSTCTSNCHGNTCQIAVNPRSLPRAKEERLELLDKDGAVLASAAYASAERNPAFARASIASDERVLRVIPGIKPGRESVAWVRFDGKTPEAMRNRDVAFEAEIPSGTRDYEIAMRIRSDGAELTEIMSRTVGSVCP